MAQISYVTLSGELALVKEAVSSYERRRKVRGQTGRKTGMRAPYTEGGSACTLAPKHGLATRTSAANRSTGDRPHPTQPALQYWVPYLNSTV